MLLETVGGAKETHQLGGGMDGGVRTCSSTSQMHKKVFQIMPPPRLPFIFWPSFLKKSRQQFTFEGCTLS